MHFPIAAMHGVAAAVYVSSTLIAATCASSDSAPYGYPNQTAVGATGASGTGYHTASAAYAPTTGGGSAMASGTSNAGAEDGTDGDASNTTSSDGSYRRLFRRQANTGHPSVANVTCNALGNSVDESSAFMWWFWDRMANKSASPAHPMTVGLNVPAQNTHLCRCQSCPPYAIGTSAAIEICNFGPQDITLSAQDIAGHLDAIENKCGVPHQKPWSMAPAFVRVENGTNIYTVRITGSSNCTFQSKRACGEPAERLPGSGTGEAQHPSVLNLNSYMGNVSKDVHILGPPKEKRANCQHPTADGTEGCADRHPNNPDPQPWTAPQLVTFATATFQSMTAVATVPELSSGPVSSAASSTASDRRRGKPVQIDRLKPRCDADGEVDATIVRAWAQALSAQPGPVLPINGLPIVPEAISKNSNQSCGEILRGNGTSVWVCNTGTQDLVLRGRTVTHALRATLLACGIASGLDANPANASSMRPGIYTDKKVPGSSYNIVINATNSFI